MTPLRTLALALLLLVAVGALFGPRASVPIRKTTLAILPKALRAGDVTASEDGTAYAYVVRYDDGARVVSSAGRGALHAECGRPTYAPHTTRLFYWAGDAVEGRPVVEIVADGRSVSTEFTGPAVLVFNDDATRWAIAAPTRGPESGEPGPIALIVDGAEYARGTDLSTPALSRDGVHLAYLAKTDGDRVALFVDGEERRAIDPPRAACAVAAREAVRGPDLPGRHVVRYLVDGTLLVATRDADGWAIRRDDTPIASYAAATIDPRDGACKGLSAFAPGSMRFADRAPVSVWWERLAGEAERWHVVRDGRPLDDVICDGPWTTQPPELSRDGRHCAYACRTTVGDQRHVHIVRDGVRYGPYAEVWGIALSDGEGDHVAYGAVPVRGDDPGERPWSLYVDGRVRNGDWQGVWRPRLSSDASTLAWEARARSDGPGVLGVNELQLTAFDDVFWGPIFERYDREVAWIVRRGRKLVRLTVDLAEIRRRARR